MIMSNQDCLQLLCNETPEFSLYFQEFQQIYSRPAAEYRIAVCGSPTVHTSAVIDGLIKIGRGSFTQVLTGSTVVSPVYLAIPLTDESFLQDIGIQQTLISVDAIIVIHDLPATELNDAERCLLHSLRGRFPDLHQRLIVLLDHADDIADQPLDQLSAAIRRNLATQLTSPPAMLAMKYCLTSAEGDERVVAPAITPLQALHQAIYQLIDNYKGGLPDMRAASIRALMDSLDFFVAKAIKRRKKQLAAGENELNQCFTLWQRDLQRLGESLRTRIADYRQR
jgi:hypothetical protein